MQTKYSDCCNAIVDKQSTGWVCTGCHGFVEPLHCSDHPKPTKEEHDREMSLDDRRSLNES